MKFPRPALAAVASRRNARGARAGSMKIAKEGYPFILTSGIMCLAAFTAGLEGLGTITGILALGFTGFFRDPERTPPDGTDLIVSPADGRVVSIARLPGDPLLGGPGTRLSIFLSPLDVHINRTPVEGKIEQIRYQRGRFIAAYKDEASERNEQNVLSIIDARGRKLAVVQVAGVLARRIVCRVQIGEWLDRGARFGLIMFGSRTDLHLPSDCRIEVVEGQRVRGGETIIGRFV
ncbi:MAG TPA: phosphatidylserine decarboxylase family protein [Candidatus Binatia bacterium]|nr:phosphatidylserine decarboxylase family protein [Candidatus Binatia bacterium]